MRCVVSERVAELDAVSVARRTAPGVADGVNPSAVSIFAADIRAAGSVPDVMLVALVASTVADAAKSSANCVMVTIAAVVMLIAEPPLDDANTVVRVRVVPFHAPCPYSQAFPASVTE